MKLFASIRARLKAATPGPWKCDSGFVMSTKEIRAGTQGMFLVARSFEGQVSSKDATMIANAPTDIATLLEALDLAMRTFKALKIHSAHPNNKACVWNDHLQDLIDGAITEIRALEEKIK